MCGRIGSVYFVFSHGCAPLGLLCAIIFSDGIHSRGVALFPYRFRGLVLVLWPRSIRASFADGPVTCFFLMSHPIARHKNILWPPLVPGCLGLLAMVLLPGCIGPRHRDCFCRDPVLLHICGVSFASWMSFWISLGVLGVMLSVHEVFP